LRNGARSYTRLKDEIDGSQSSTIKNTVFSNDPIGVIKEIEEYKENVKETNLNAPAASDDPFAQAAAMPEAGSDLPFGDPENNDADPFAGM
jgi:hypothetical protein